MPGTEEISYGTVVARTEGTSYGAGGGGRRPLVPGTRLPPAASKASVQCFTEGVTA